MKRWILFCAPFALVISTAADASAQADEVAPRVVGERGDTSIGVSGFLDKFMSSEEIYTTHLTTHIDVTRFLTRHIAIRGGLVGTADIGGDADDRSTGPGASALHALGGVFYYFTPQSMASVYSGAEYRAALTSRAEQDAGTVFGKGGVEAAVTPRLRIFLEGGYGVHLTRGTDEERLTRIVGEIGFRFRF